MSEQALAEVVRPTKKQRELLEFITNFIAEHGYSPSYREIMAGCNYTSVATVALHINSLIKRGHLIKRDRSARSLEVVDAEPTSHKSSSYIKVGDEKWLVDLIDSRFKLAENDKALQNKDIDTLYVLVATLRIVGLEAAAQSFVPRLTALKTKL